jgi:tetratricopeptide (TPR) repeat protein
MPKQVEKPLVLLIYFVLAVSAMLVFWQVWNFGFANYDDNDYVSENSRVLNGLTIDGFVWAFTTGHAGNWHPLTWLSLMLDCQFFGAGAGWMHLVNVFFHLANTLLLFAVLKKMTGSLWSSAFVAAAFALHPMHVESVAWIAERKDVLSTFFLLLTLAAFTSYVSHPSVFRYIAALVMFALGLMAKPMLVTLPFVLLLLDYWPLERFGRRSVFYLIREKIPFFVLSVISCVITFLVQRRSGAVADIKFISLNSRIANVFLSLAQYIGKLFWPQNLAVFYPFNAAASIPFRHLAACVLLLVVISFFVLRYGRSQKYLPVGWFWFLGTLVPVIGIVQVGSQAYADRYTYVPYIGLFLMIAWLLPQLLSKWPYRKTVSGVLMVMVLTAIAICAHRQVSFWNNSISLFSHAIEVTQNNWLAHNNIGVAYGELDRWQEAIETYKQAIRIRPDYAKAHNNLGIAYGRLDRNTDAIEAYKQAIRIRPDYAEAYYNLGIAYGKLGRWQDAAEAFTQAVKIKPDYILAYNNLGVAYNSLGRSDDAIETFRQTIKIKPDYVEGYYNLGRVLGNLNRWKEAIDAYKQAIRIRPDYANAHLALGLTYLLSGDKDSALAEYKILKSLNPQFADKLLNQINK